MAGLSLKEVALKCDSDCSTLGKQLSDVSLRMNTIGVRVANIEGRLDNLGRNWDILVDRLNIAEAALASREKHIAWLWRTVSGIIVTLSGWAVYKFF